MKTKSLHTLCFLILHSSFILSTHAQGTAFTYQGRVLDNGTNFTGTGQFQFALVTSTNFNHQATAAANLNGVSPNYFVSSCTLNTAGSEFRRAARRDYFRRRRFRRDGFSQYPRRRSERR